mmetsp:Transcript_27804/g.60834  ORF Transcript_27804/g.60834 Transcript_27804/m.60834 type:complete len:311 (-) Transcript_27804:128-1060(-)|eukprot:CAMPEP_0118930846 /NCGR_PEP_ID=MMETSP1169-20130426/7395_1 /TAXON_ID=36882 /ORGANISM="Pyramimonas obovata, Strain CCMP722" /LENGTH=310 /DNA_ID=CAMNT_0006873263 /DNA_START=211 /DNA_END=1143 /DNA_ORIENTATION=+
MGCANSTLNSTLGLKASWDVETAVDTVNPMRLLKSLGNGGSPNGLPDKEGSALHRAVHQNSIMLTKLLIDHGADLNITDCYKRTPLDLAVICNTAEPGESRTRIQKLLEAANEQLFAKDLQQALQNAKVGEVVVLSTKHKSSCTASPLRDPPAAASASASATSDSDCCQEHSDPRSGPQGSGDRPPSTCEAHRKADAAADDCAGAEEEEEDLCILCQDSPPQVAVLPCNHECMCLECAVRTVPFVLQGVACVQTCGICRSPMAALKVTRAAPPVAASEQTSGRKSRGSLKPLASVNNPTLVVQPSLPAVH